MNENNQYQNSPAAEASGTATNTQDAASAGCCQKMMTACKDAFNRFISARVGISYNITTRVMGEGQGNGSSASTKGQSQSSNAQGQQGNNTMTKQGELELRMTDLTICALMMCAVMSMICAVKGMCCKKGCKCKHKC